MSSFYGKGLDVAAMADAWNAAGTTFTAIKMNVTDTASAAGSLLMDLQVGGASRFNVRKDGRVIGAEFNAGNGALVGGKVFFSSAQDAILARVAAGVLQVEGASSVGGVLQFKEMTAPSAPSADNVRIYAQDNGAGKTQLMALFPTGAAQQIAIEP